MSRARRENGEYVGIRLPSNAADGAQKRPNQAGYFAAVPYYADVGTGSSDLTWQAAGGVAYAFGGWDAMLMHRHLYYD